MTEMSQMSPAAIAIQACQSTITNITTNTADETVLHSNAAQTKTMKFRNNHNAFRKSIRSRSSASEQSVSSTIPTGHQNNWYTYDLSVSTAVPAASSVKDSTAVERPLPRLNSTIMRDRLKRRMHSFQKRNGASKKKNARKGKQHKTKARNIHSTNDVDTDSASNTVAVAGGGVLNVFSNFSDYIFACQTGGIPEDSHADGSKSEGTASTTNLDDSSDASGGEKTSNLEQLRRKYLHRNNNLNLPPLESRSPQDTTLREDANILEQVRKTNPLFSPRMKRQRQKQLSLSSSVSSPNKDSKLLVAPKLRVFRSRSSPTKHQPPLSLPLDGLDIVRELQKEEHEGIIRDLQKGETRQRADQNTDGTATESGSLFSFASDLTSTMASKKKGYNNLTQSLSSMSLTLSRSIQGPASGTFENVASEEDNVDTEVLDTYTTYRMNQTYVNSIIRGISCTLPLYHQKFGGSNTLKHACSEPIASNFLVRGETYHQNGLKVPSKEAIFALLGADNLTRTKGEDHECNTSLSSDSYLNKLRVACKKKGIRTPFLVVINFVVPWGNFVCYFYRPDGSNGGALDLENNSDSSEKLLKEFLEGDTASRNKKLKFIPNIVVGPWALRKLVGTNPAMIGQKIPTTYYGSVEDGYIEVCLNVTKGGKVANSICSAVAGKASAISIDLSFLLQGDNEHELPEQILSVIRLHHVKLKL